jgi:NTP pyrophosphatase (non-canonical NTP hydrolase)
MTIKDLSDRFELIAKAYSEKLNFTRDDNWYLMKLQEEIGEVTQSYLRMQGKARKHGKSDEELKEAFAKELADAFTMILLVARNHKIDLEKEIKAKITHWERNDK